MNGILFLQRASRLKLERALKARPKERDKRLKYERNQAIAKAIQDMQSKKDSESSDEGSDEGLDTVVEDSQTLANSG